MKKFYKVFVILSVLLYATNIFAQAASITWPLTSTVNPNTPVGNIQGNPESIGVGPNPTMSVFAYSSGQRLWVGNTGWIGGALDLTRYIQFDASPTSGNNFTVTNVSFNYGDFPLSGTNFNILNFQAYYSTDGWLTKIFLTTTPLVYLNTTMSVFTKSLNVSVANGQTFSLRIYPYAVQNGIAATPTFAIHNNVIINGTTTPEAPILGSIGGLKFNDLNGDGLQNNGELGIAGWTINLTYPSGGGVLTTLTTTTDASGNYSFTNLTANTYTVSEASQSGWNQTFPNSPGTYTVILTAGQNTVNINFGNKQLFGSIGGLKFNDLNGNGLKDAGELGIPNWTINLTGSANLTTTTNASGNYSFNNLSAGTYTITEVNQFGWQQTLPTSPGTYTETLTQGQEIGNRNFGNTQIVSGQNGACLTWNLLSSKLVTSTTGNITGVPETIAIGSPFLSTGQAANPMSIYGYSNGQQLWVGNNGGTWVPDPPAPNGILDLQRYIQFDASPNSGNSFTVTNVSFNYGDLPWSTNFNILAFQAYYSTDGWNTPGMVLNSTPLIYLNTTMSLFSQSISGVVVPSGQTFSLRIYPFPVLHGITIMPSFATHNNVTICGTTAPQVVTTGSICGIKFNDLNNNGIKDGNEPGLPNWTINLTGTSTSSTTTDINGNYCFSNLKAGSYTIAEVGQNGWVQTAPVSPGTYTVTVAAGQYINNINFGNNFRSIQGCVQPPPGMVAWWALDETIGVTSIDLAGFNNAGTQINGPVPVAGKVLGGLQFDGINDYIEVPDHSELNFGTGNFSIDAWVRTNENTGQKTIVNKIQFPLNQGYSLYLSNGEVRLILSASSPVFYVSSVQVADGNWHHIAVTVNRTDPSGIKFYKDGIMISTSDPTTNPGTITAISPLRIGSLSFTAGDLFKGSLDEIELFNRVLISSEIVSIYNAGSAGKCKPDKPTGIKNIENLPQRFELLQSYPNPFNPTSTIRYEIPLKGFVKISVYDLLGREIKVLVNEEKNPGQYEIVFDAKNLASGIYFYTIRTRNFTQSKKMILMK